MKIKFIKYAFKHKKLYLCSFVGLSLSVFFSSIGPFLMGCLIDNASTESGNGFWHLSVLMLLSYLLAGIFHYMEEYSSDIISKEVASDVRKDLFSFIQKEDWDFFSKRNASDLMSRTTTDANNIGLAFGFCGIYALEIFATIIAMLIAIIRLDFIAVIVPLLLMPIVILLSSIAEKKGDKVLDEISDENAAINKVASEAITGIRTVKAFGKEDLERKRFNVHNRRFMSLSILIDLIWADWYSPVETASRLMVVLNVLACGFLVIADYISLGSLVSIFQYTSQLALPIIDLGWLLRTFALARSAERKINDIVKDEPKVKDGDMTFSPKEGTLEFKNVSLENEGKKLLDDVSFKLERGKSIAIMGSSGSGKSLIASLAMRFLDPTEGEILIDGQDIKNLELDVVRGFSSIVSQDIFLFSDSILDNIRLGQKETLSEEDCIIASRKAKASEFIEGMSSGYSTIIGERGVGLSGGQKQRLSIARAFAKKSQVLILDDATSALDVKTERYIEKAIREESDRSLLIIAHRISAVSFANEIIILDSGRIVERGCHDDLIKRHGIYYKTFVCQYPEEARDER